MHLRVDPFNDGHQIVKNVFCVVHSGIHEVPEKENKTDSIFLIPHSMIFIEAWSNKDRLCIQKKKVED